MPLRVSTPPRLRVLALHAYLKRLAWDDKPILIGPWRSEVGVEHLYWIPFLNAVAKRVPNFWQRAIILTRGGASAWYHDGTCKAVDLYTLRNIDDFRQENFKDQRLHQTQKQFTVTPWDKAAITDAAVRALGKDASYHVLHPWWMHWVVQPWWEDRVGMSYLTPLMEFPFIPTPALPVREPQCFSVISPQGFLEIELPPQFVAVKLYDRATFPDNPMTREFCKNLLTRLAAQMPVVLLHQPQIAADDHTDIPQPAIPNVYTLPAFPVERNLEYLSAVLGRAHAFVGTYGGVAQLALRMGVRSLSVYNAFGGTARAHLTLSQAMATVTNVPFVAMSVSEVGLCKLALRERVVEKVVEKVA